MDGLIVDGLISHSLSHSHSYTLIHEGIQTGGRSPPPCVEAARSAASFMDECVAVAVAEAVAVAVTEAVAEADQSIHDQSIHDPSIHPRSIHKQTGGRAVGRAAGGGMRLAVTNMWGAASGNKYVGARG